MKRYLILLGCIILFSVPSGAHAIGVEFAVGGWSQSPSGDLAYKSTSAQDTLDLEDDLDYDSEMQVTGRLKLDMPLLIPNIYLMATPMEYDGTGSKDVNFTFGDQTFNGGATFYSKVRLTNYDVALYYGLPFVETATAGLFNVDLGVNVRLMDLKAEIEQNGKSESESIFLPIPMLYAAASFQPIERLGFEAELRGIAYGGNGYYSAIGRIKANIFGPLFAAAGYRYDFVDVEEDDLHLDTHFAGPFFELGARF